jgi:CubicO group peptidase (beta-lactamase class C family)
MLLLHLSGLPAESFVWRDGDVPPEERLQRVLAAPLESQPGEMHRYSCVGYVAAAALAEQVTGTPWRALFAEHVLAPLDLTAMAYGPVDPSQAVATERQPWVGRGLVRGEVHDELNWYLGGAAGNAGVFSNVADVLTFVGALVEGHYLGPEARHWMTTNQLPVGLLAEYGQALGPRVDDPQFMGSAGGVGHPGFTGTMWVADPGRGIAAVLLTNRVHPSRDAVDLGPFRRRFSEAVASLLTSP